MLQEDIHRMHDRGSMGPVVVGHLGVVAPLDLRQEVDKLTAVQIKALDEAQAIEEADAQHTQGPIPSETCQGQRVQLPTVGGLDCRNCICNIGLSKILPPLWLLLALRRYLLFRRLCNHSIRLRHVCPSSAWRLQAPRSAQAARHKVHPTALGLGVLSWRRLSLVFPWPMEDAVVGDSHGCLRGKDLQEVELVRRPSRCCAREDPRAGLVDQLHHADDASSPCFQGHAHDAACLEACLGINRFVEALIIVGVMGDDWLASGRDMTRDARRDGYPQLSTSRVHSGVELLAPRIDEKHGGHLCAYERLGLVHDLPQDTLGVQVRIDEEGALHERVDCAQEGCVGAEALLLLQRAERDTPSNGPAVHAEDLLEVLLDGIPQCMVGEEIPLGELRPCHWRSPMVR
mmetsp:Transcript_13459/g.28120  ORF Transcript_13459/g.28120 Transcript_13459/m.28120 type:complete len:401 (+) Transcript_13459:784-1986(+)